MRTFVQLQRRSVPMAWFIFLGQRGQHRAGHTGAPRAGTTPHPCGQFRAAGERGGRARPRYLLGAGDPRDAAAHHGEAAPLRTARPRHRPAIAPPGPAPRRLRSAGAPQLPLLRGQERPLRSRPEAAFPRPAGISVPSGCCLCTALCSGDQTPTGAPIPG